MIKNLEKFNTGVTFITDQGNYHTFRDFGYRFTGMEISLPEPKRKLIEDVQGIDSYIDMTDTFGQIRFKNRVITLTFDRLEPDFETWHEWSRKISNALHARYARITLDTDRDYYWTGFVNIQPKKTEKILSDLTISIDAYPYQRLRIPYRAVLQAGINTLLSDRMPTTAEITTSGSITCTYRGRTYNIPAGKTKSPFELLEGVNTVNLSGPATFEWIGGKL